MRGRRQHARPVCRSPKADPLPVRRGRYTKAPGDVSPGHSFNDQSCKTVSPSFGNGAGITGSSHSRSIADRASTEAFQLKLSEKRSKGPKGCSCCDQRRSLWDRTTRNSTVPNRGQSVGSEVCRQRPSERCKIALMQPGVQDQRLGHCRPRLVHPIERDERQVFPDSAPTCRSERSSVRSISTSAPAKSLSRNEINAR